jgi:hypothetical protein
MKAQGLTEFPANCYSILPLLLRRNLLIRSLPCLAIVEIETPGLVAESGNSPCNLEIENITSQIPVISSLPLLRDRGKVLHARTLDTQF